MKLLLLLFPLLRRKPLAFLLFGKLSCLPGRQFLLTLLFLLLVDWLGWPASGAGHDGLTTAVVLALVYWMLAIAVASVWLMKWPQGPLEWVYRRFSDAS